MADYQQSSGGYPQSQPTQQQYPPQLHTFAPPSHQQSQQHQGSLPVVNLHPPPPAVPQKEPFAIKVMRLPSPSFHTSTPVAWSLDSHLSAPSSSSSSFSLSSHLLLPTHIGTVYLGETFRACISVSANTNATYTNVALKLELKTSSRLWTLHESTTPTMNSGESKELLVSHNLAELGVNKLDCLVTYKDENGERRTYPKYFKFVVHDPFTIHTTIHQRDTSLLLAEVQLTSLIQRSITLHKVVFEQIDSQKVAVKELSEDTTMTTNGDKTIAASSSSLLLPGATSRTFLFQFTISPSYTESLLGRLQIRWTSLTGEHGRIKSSGISRTLRNMPNALITPGSVMNNGIECTIVAAPSSVEIETAFEVQCSIRNHTNMPMLTVVQLQKERMGQLLPHGPTIRQLGLLPSNDTRVFTMELVGVGLGVQRISGIRVSFVPYLIGTTQPNVAAAITQDFDHLHAIEIMAAK